jgi:hypothetical protein
MGLRWYVGCKDWYVWLPVVFYSVTLSKTNNCIPVNGEVEPSACASQLEKATPITFVWHILF